MYQSNHPLAPSKTDSRHPSFFPCHRTMSGSGVVYSGRRRKRIPPPPFDPRRVFSGALAQLKQVVRLKRKQSQRLYPPPPPSQQRQLLPVLKAVREGVALKPLLAIPQRPALPRPERFAPRIITTLNSRRTYSVKYSFTFVISNDDPRTERGTITQFRGTNTDLEIEIHDEIEERYGHTQYHLISVDITSVQDITTQEIMRYDINNMRMRDYKPLDVVNLFDNTIRLTETTENCVREVLRKKYPDISKQKKDPIGKLGTADGVSTEDLITFCSKYKIRMVGFDVYGNVIGKHIPETKSHKHASLVYLAFNDHIYPVKGKELHFKHLKPQKLQQHSHEELQVFFSDLIHVHRRHPSEVKINPDDQTIRSFIDGDTHHFYNPHYDECELILKSYDLHHLIVYNISFQKTMELITEYYETEDLRSFFPVDHIKTPLYYQSPITEGETVTIDKNKCYSEALSSLDFLLTVDYRQSPVETTDIDVLRSDALYVATPECQNVLLPKQDIYAGEHLLYAKKQGVKFKVQERILCKRKYNTFNRIILDLYNRLPEHVFKNFINRTIGVFQSSVKKRAKETNAMVVGEQERHPDMFWFPFGDGSRFVQYESEPFVGNVYNHKPIAIQIKDRANRFIYEKMRELNVFFQHIRQINTDSITIDARAVKNIRVEGKGLRGWKLGHYDIKQPTRNVHTSTITMKQNLRNHNTLITGDAGNGKSYHIEHTLIPSLATDYLIVSSKHSAIVQHRKNGRNAQVIQKYEFNHTTPTEQHIIVEECGIMTRTHWDLLYKWHLLGKTITSYGDFNQLLPVKEHAQFSAQSWLDLFFTNQTILSVNRRNDFTAEYYKDLREGKLDLKAELLKYSTKTPEEAEVVIAYRNEIVDKYNARMAEFHGITYELTETGTLVSVDDGVPILCKDNDLRDKDIYNNMLFDSEEVDEGDLKHFKLAYARTLYNLQGDAVKSFYVAPEDMEWFCHPRVAYTLISRLKTKTD